MQYFEIMGEEFQNCPLKPSVIANYRMSKKWGKKSNFGKFLFYKYLAFNTFENQIWDKNKIT